VPEGLGLSSYFPYLLYAAGIAAFLLSVFGRPIVGIYFLTPLIPLQTLRYSINGLPLGHSVVDIMWAGVLLGLLVKGEPILPKTPWNRMLLIYAIFTFVSLCFGSLYLGRALPFAPSDPRLADWKNYMVMPVILILVAATVKEPRQMKALIMLMCVGTFLVDRSFWNIVSGRDFSNFASDLQENGAMGYAGVNGLATFEAQVSTLLLALLAFEQKYWLRLVYLGLVVFSANCLMYSLSREGYIAFLGGCLFLGMVKLRKLLVLLAVFAFTWSSLVPGAVKQRVEMTYNQQDRQLDHSSQVRLDLWNEAVPIITAHPVLGLGFDTYSYMKHVHDYRDSHNVYVKFLVETGFVGLLLFLCLLAKMFLSGYRLFQHATDPFLRSLGLGLAGWLVCAAIANFFGDRWTGDFLQITGYMWIFGGLVSRALLLEQSSVPFATQENNSARAADEVSETVETPATGLA
jgi:putative inorganic carbon (hco3(-)) transporter